MKHYELIINTKQADVLSERVVSYLPNPPLQEQKGFSSLSLEFYADPGNIKELEKKLREESLRYMILAKTKKKEAKPRRRLIKKPLAAPSLGQKDERKEEKVDINKIDEKLEELLKEE